MTDPSSGAVRSFVWSIGDDSVIARDRPIVMGILNVTPDSFFDGGRHDAVDAALACASKMVEEGVDVIDVGGESTRPGAARVDASEQIRRTEPIVRAIADRFDVVVSIDTTRAIVARAAIDAGAAVVNDVSGGTEDPAILDVAAEARCGVVLMHRLVAPDRDRYSDRYEREPSYDGDVVGVIRTALAERRDAAVERGVHAERVALDPGFGFGKSVGQNLELLAGLDALRELGSPILAGLSRKSFLGAITGRSDPADRLGASIAAAIEAARCGATILRVHDVGPTIDALRAAAVFGARSRAASPPT